MKEKNYEISSDNIFEDLGLDNAEELKTKTLLMIEISRIVKRRKLKQVEIATILGIPQSKVSNLLSGNLRSFSTDRLIKFLNKLDQDVNITVKPKPKNRKHAHTVVSIPQVILPLAAKGR